MTDKKKYDICTLPLVDWEIQSEAEEQMVSEEANHDLDNRDRMAKSMIAWLVDWKYVEITNTEDGTCIIPSNLLMTAKAFKRESLLNALRKFGNEKTNI